MYLAYFVIITLKARTQYKWVLYLHCVNVIGRSYVYYLLLLSSISSHRIWTIQRRTILYKVSRPKSLYVRKHPFAYHPYNVLFKFCNFLPWFTTIKCSLYSNLAQQNMLYFFQVNVKDWHKRSSCWLGSQSVFLTLDVSYML